MLLVVSSHSLGGLQVQAQNQNADFPGPVVARVQAYAVDANQTALVELCFQIGLTEVENDSLNKVPRSLGAFRVKP